MKIKHLFLALVVFSLAFVSCKKDEKPTPQNDRKPLAVRTATGSIMSLVDCEKLTAKLNTNKDYTDKYVVESVEIVDKTVEEPYYFIINLIDIENEKSISCAYIGDYIEEVSNTFYATKDFADGNYGFTDPSGKQHKFVGHEQVEPGPCTTSGFWISCEGEGCKNGTCKPHYFRCPDCESLDEDNPGACSFSGLGYGSDAIIKICASVVIGALL